jgi:hypothetical protein
MTLVIAASPLMAMAARRLLAPERFHRAANRFADRFRVDDGLFVDGVVRRRFRRIGLNAILATRHRELNELHRRSGYVKSQKRTISFS